MFFSFTSLSYIFLSGGLGLLSFRMYQYWRQSRTITAKLLFFFSVPLFAFTMVRIITGIFFLNNFPVLLNSVFIVLFLEGLAASIMGYLVVHLKLSSRYAWVGFAAFFFMTAVTLILGFNVSYGIFIGKWGAVNWGFQRGGLGTIYTILRTVIIAVPFISLAAVMMQSGKESSNPVAKKRALGLSSVLFLGVLTGVIDFIFSSFLKIGLIFRDFSIILTGLVLLIVVLMTHKSPSAEEKI